MELIVVTPEGTIKDELPIVNGMFTNGLKKLHLRKPSYSIEAYKDYIERIKPEYQNRVVIHGHYELFGTFELGGIHLNEASRTDALVWAQVKEIPPSKISSSFHSWQEITENEFRYGYVFISPVFDSISKPGYNAGIALAGATATKQKMAAAQKYCPAIVGLGGVGPNQIELLRRNAFDGAAMLGAIWGNDDPSGAFLDAMVEIRRCS